jgi:hypothetical protein
MAPDATSGPDASADSFVGSDYIPTLPPPPFGSDPYLDGGSFEGNLGSGWDMCRVPFAVELVSKDSSASHGTTFVRSSSSMSCASCGPGNEAVVAFWLAEPVPQGQVGLYFDVTSFGLQDPSGTLHLEETQACGTVRALAEIPLAQLHADATWSTRCVNLEIPKPMVEFGLHVKGASFDIGLDAFRFGAPCR